MAVITASNPSIQMLVSLLFHLELEGFVLLASWVVHSKNKAEQVADTPNFSFSFSFSSFCSVTTYCNILLVVLYTVMSAPPTRNAQYLCTKCNVFTYAVCQGISNTGALLHFKEDNNLLREFLFERKAPVFGYLTLMNVYVHT